MQQTKLSDTLYGDRYGVIESFITSGYYNNLVANDVLLDIALVKEYVIKVENAAYMNNFDIENEVVSRRIGVILAGILEQQIANRDAISEGRDNDVVNIEDCFNDLFNQEFNIKLNKVQSR